MLTYPPEVQQIIEDIRDLSIQGATRIALAGLEVVEIVKNLRANDIQELKQNIQQALDDLLAARPTEPCMWNAVQLVLHAVSQARNRKEAVAAAQEAVDAGREHIISARKEIVKIAVRHLAGHKTIYTHCHSSTVTQTIAALFAKGADKSFQVFCTETRPRYQGRKTAKELAEKGVPVTLTVDSAFPYSLDSATVVLLGADEIMPTGVVFNKVGSSPIARAASRRNVPLYILTDSWKFAPPSFRYASLVEERPPEEVWENPPEGVRIRNPAFDRIDPSHITGIITELGVCRPEELAAKVGEAYPFLKK